MSKMKNICFIVYLEHASHEGRITECISKLNVPEGMEIELNYVNSGIPSRDYNEIIKRTESEIIIYIRDYVILLYNDLLFSVMDIFEQDKNIGMIGTVGAKRIATDGKIVNGIMNNTGVLGKIYSSDKQLEKLDYIEYGAIENAYEEVDGIEGDLIITNRKVLWREDLFEDFNFLEVSQCLEYKRKDIKVVVAKQSEPWFLRVNTGENEKQNTYLDAKERWQQEYKTYFPPVSILIPTYNRAEFVQNAIESILAQTYKNVEIVICDNSENNITEELIHRKYMVSYDNVKYYHNEKNLGLLGNLQRTYEKASYDIRAVLCDDDRLTKEAIEKQMNYLWLDLKNEISIVSFLRVYEVLKRDQVIDGEVAINLMAAYNLSLFSFLGLFRSNMITEPFGTLNGRKPACNMDRYVGYLALTKGKGAYIHEEFYHSSEHDDHASEKPEVIISAGNDLAHEILTMRQYGYLRDDKYEKALDTAEWYYHKFVLNDNIPQKLNENAIIAMKDTYVYLEKIYREKLALYKQQVNRKHNLNLLADLDEENK